MTDFAPATQSHDTESGGDVDHADKATSAAMDFRAIYEAESSYVWHTLRRIGVEERDLEDVLHDVFVVVFRRLAEYDPRRPLKPWLFGIAFRVASDYRRSGRRTKESLAPAAESLDGRPGADEQMAEAERRELVLTALRAIDPDRRAVFVMHDIDGHPAPEIAVALVVPVTTVYSRLRVAREEFTAAIKRLQRRGQS